MPTFWGIEQWDPPSHWHEGNLVYDWIMHKLFIRKLVVLKVKDIITGVKRTFDPAVIMNNS